MKKHDKIDLILAENGKLLTQAADVPTDERVFSSRVYDSNMENWTEWSEEQVNKFIKERGIDRIEGVIENYEEVEDPNPETEETL